MLPQPSSQELLKLLGPASIGDNRRYPDDFDGYERLVEAARNDQQTCVVALLGGDAGLRCGEMMALEWSDIDLSKRQVCVARSDWKGHVTATKGGRLRYVPLTRRLTDALRQARHLRGARVLCDPKGQPFTQKIIQVMMRKAARWANVKPGAHILRHNVLFAPGDAWRASARHSGTRRPSEPADDAALHAPEPGIAGRSNPVT